MKKSIIHIFWSFTKGGAEYLVKDITENSSALHTIIVINNHYDRSLINSFHNKIKFILINRKPKSLSLIWTLKFIKAIYSIKNRIIHCHNYSLGYLIWIFISTPKFLTVHGFDIKLNKYNFFDEIICVSYPLSDYVKNKFNFKTTTILNGVDNNLIKIKKKYNPKTKLLFVGRFDDHIKGLDILIKAVKCLIDDHVDVELTIYGKGKKKDELLKYIASNKLEQNIIFKGAVSRNFIYSSLSNYDLSIIPSRKESFSLFAVESMMAKVPIIVSNVPGLREVSGMDSFKFNTENVDDLSKKILMAISEIRSNKILIRTNSSFDYSISSFNLNQMIENYESLYNSQ